MQSFPEEREDDFDTMQQKADAFTEEILSLILGEARNDTRFKLDLPEIREHTFNNKFPYTEMEEEEKLEEIIFKPVIL